MPTYDYICDACGHEFEAFESMKVDSQTICPKCHEVKLRRKIGAGAAILFKGSGFYQTDYRSQSYKAGAKADKSADSASSSGSSGSDSSSSKPAETSSGPAKADSTKPATGSGSGGSS